MITASSVSFRYEKSSRLTLENISFSLPSCGVVGVVGANGSGKSTLLKIISGVHIPAEGEVHVGDHAAHAHSAKQQVIALSGNENLPDFLTGRELIQLYASLYHRDVDHDRVDDLAQRYGLSGWIDSLMEDYSHGMKKKLQLLCALLLRRQVTILDETLNGVDFTSIVQAKRDLKDLGRESLVIVCTHDNFLVEGLVDRYIGLRSGRVGCDITSDELEMKYHSLSNMLEHLIEDVRR